MASVALQWHELSDHAADGTPFGGWLCNCEQPAKRVQIIIDRQPKPFKEAHPDTMIGRRP